MLKLNLILMPKLILTPKAMLSPIANDGPELYPFKHERSLAVPSNDCLLSLSKTEFNFVYK